MGNVWDAIRKHQQKSPPPPDEAEPTGTTPPPTEAAEPADLASAQPESPESRPEDTPTQDHADPNDTAKGAKNPPHTVHPETFDTLMEPSTRKQAPDAETPLPPPDPRYAEELVAHHDRGGSAAEEYRALRTSLMANARDERLRFLVTSAQAGEGKTVTVMNFGLILAERVHEKTILVDGDLRRGRIAELTGLPYEPGFAEILQNQADIEDCLQPTSYPNLFILPHGRIPRGEVGQLMGHHKLESLFEILKEQFDHILVDTPPIGGFTDAGIIGREIGQALLVMRMNKTRRESADRAIRLLEAADVNVAGIVLSHRRYHIPNYLYRYA